MKSLASLGGGTLDAYARGAICATDRGGNPYNFVGDAQKLYRYDSRGLNDVSRAAGYNPSDQMAWAFAQHSNLIFAANRNDALQYFDLQTSTTFLDVTGAPRAKWIGEVGPHIVVGNTYDGTDGERPARVWWPAITNPLAWPTPGTDEAVENQSDYSDLEGNGGDVQGIIEGSEVGAVVQEHHVWRMDYRGGDVIYELNRIEPVRGSLVPGLTPTFGREFIFCDESGWYRCDYSQSQPIGEEKINRTFLADLDTAYLHRVSWARDPNAPLIYIGYPGSGNTSGTPNKVLVYNYVLNRFAEGDLAHELLTCALAVGNHLDSTPDDDLDAFEPTSSFDDRQSVFGALEVGAYDTTHELGTFTGTPLRAVLETGDIELAPGRRAMCTLVRPLVKGARVTVQLGGSARSADPISFGRERFVEEDGEAPVRLDARYHRVRTHIANEAFTEAVGLDMTFIPTGTR